MMKLIQNIDVYAPQHLGKKDVLTINDKIVKIKDAGSISAEGFLSETEIINGHFHDPFPRAYLMIHNLGPDCIHYTFS